MKLRFLLLVSLLTELILTAPCLAQATDTPLESIDALRQRAQMGDVSAQRMLGSDLLNDGDSSDDEEGLDWLRRAARSGDWSSAYYLGQAYLYRWHSLSDDDTLTETIEWLRMAAQNVPPDNEVANDLYALLGRLYSGFELRDVRGHYPPLDDEEAIKWYRICAAGYDSYCQRELGDLLLKSPATAAEGYRWLRHAADLAHPEAMFELGELYAAGDIVKKDNVQSLAWFERAQKWNPGDGGYGQDLRYRVERKIAEISRPLSPVDIAKANDMAADFHPVHHY